MQGFLLPWGITFIPSSLWSKYKNHIPMAIWWWNHWQHVSKIFDDSMKKMSQCGKKIILYSVLFLHVYSLLLETTLYSQHFVQSANLTYLWWFDGKIIDKMFGKSLVFPWRKWVNKVTRWNCILIYFWMPIHIYKE